MFSVYCPHHGAEVLLSERRIESLEQRDGSLNVHWQCWCGTRGSFTDGRAPTPTTLVGPSARSRVA